MIYHANIWAAPSICVTEIDVRYFHSSSNRQVRCPAPFRCVPPPAGVFVFLLAARRHRTPRTSFDQPNSLKVKLSLVNQTFPEDEAKHLGFTAVPHAFTSRHKRPQQLGVNMLLSSPLKMALLAAVSSSQGVLGKLTMTKV